MALLVAILLAVFVLDPPWEWAAVGAGVAIEALEAVLLVRWSKRRSAAVGVSTLVGRRALVVSDCRPDGQVRVAGELWHASCRGGAAAGDDVVVLAVDGLTLEVEPA